MPVTRRASLQFPYRREPSAPSAAYPDRTSIPRPRIELRLFHEDRFVKLLALVDSGADDCLFPLEVAHFLKLPLKRDAVHHYGGIGSGTISAAFATVGVEVGKWSIPLYAGFSDSPSVVPILGQDGFFNAFEINFNRVAETLTLKEFNKRPERA